MEYFTFKKKDFVKANRCVHCDGKTIWRKEFPYFLNHGFYLFTLNRAWKER